MEKLCIFCSHFSWTGPHISGCDTCGSYEGSVACRKTDHYWDVPEDEDELRKLLLTADGCAHYDPPKKPAATKGE